MKFWILIVCLLIGLYAMVVIWMSLWPNEKTRYNADRMKSVSVVIPCKNEAQNLTQLLTLLVNRGAEIIVVDDHSDDDTFASAESLIVKAIKNHGRGKKAAIKSGIDSAEGEIILTLDADIIISENWLQLAIQEIQQQSAACYIIPVLIKPLAFRPFKLLGNLIEIFDGIDMLGLANTTRAFASIQHPIMANGAALAFTKDLYDGAEAHLRTDIASGDDTFLVQYAAMNKQPVVYFHNPDLQVSVRSERNLGRFLKQRIRWGQKTSAYPSWRAKGLAWLIFLTNLVTIPLLYQGLIAFERWALMALFCRFAIDLIFLISGVVRYRKWQLLLWYGMLLFYPFYIVITALAGFVYRPKWK